VDLTAGLDDVEKRKFLSLPRLEFRPLGRPASRYTETMMRLHIVLFCIIVLYVGLDKKFGYGIIAAVVTRHGMGL
jgi:hypothetical protein